MVSLYHFLMGYVVLIGLLLICPKWTWHRSPRSSHDDVIKWKHSPRYWPLLRGIHRSPVNSPHKGQWRGALMFPLICVWINAWVNNREAGDLRRYHAHYDVTVMWYYASIHKTTSLTDIQHKKHNDDVITWKLFLSHWPVLDSPQK